MDIQRTATQTRVDTRTKTVAAVGLTLLAGLGAYGFGFLPGFENDKLQQERAVCYEVCLSNHNLCKEKSKDPTVCESSFQECNTSCSAIGEQAQEQQQMAYEDVLKKEEINESPSDLPQDKVPTMYPTDCAGQCEYDLAKCLTYQPRAICQSIHETCQARCAPTPPPAPEISTTTLTIRPDSHPLERILIAQEDVWYHVAQYRASSATEEITVRSIGVEGNIQGTNVIRDVAIAQSGRILGQGFLPAGRSSRTRIDLSASPLRVPSGGSAVFQIWIRVNQVRHPLITGEVSTTTLAVAAPTVQMGLALNFSDYQYDVEASAASPRIQVRVPWTSGDFTWGNLYTVRNTRPYITPRALPSADLVAAPSVDLYRFQAVADVEGPVALKKMTFNLRASLSPSSDLRLSRFRLRRGSVEVPASEVRIFDEDGNDLQNPATTTLSLARNRQVIVLFNQQQMLNTTGHVFTLQARVDGALQENDSLAISFAREPRFHSMLNGYLSSEALMLPTAGGNLRGPHLDLENPPRDRSLVPAPFIWSDLLSPTHDTRLGSAGGSDDWIPDHQIDDLDRVQVLQTPAPRR